MNKSFIIRISRFSGVICVMFSSEDSFFKSIADYLIILLFCCKNLFQIERYLLLRTPSHFVYILSMSETAHEVGMFVSTDIVSEYRGRHVHIV